MFVPAKDENKNKNKKNIDKVEPKKEEAKKTDEYVYVEPKDKEDLVIDYIEGPPLTKKTPKTKNKKVKHAVIIPPSPNGMFCYGGNTNRTHHVNTIHHHPVTTSKSGFMNFFRCRIILGDNFVIGHSGL